MAQTDVSTLFQRHLPSRASAYCYELWKRNNFTLKIKKARITKYGDYRFDPKTNSHRITINNDLNPYAFLITYLHEVAHLFTFREHGRKVKPHGRHWKTHFKLLMGPMIEHRIFPEDVHRAVVMYMKDPAATSCSDPGLIEILNQYNVSKATFLKDLPPGALFSLNDRRFRKGTLRRTRYVCEEVKSGKKYLISGHAGIRPD